MEDDRRLYTFEELSDTIQASESELRQALTERRILLLDGYLRPLLPGYLHQILILILNCLVARSLPRDSAPVQVICEQLNSEHDVRIDVVRQVLRWYGDLSDFTNSWAVDTKKCVKDIGIGLLRPYTHENTIAMDEFVLKWKDLVGDSFETEVEMDLLSVNFIVFYAESTH